MEGTYTCKKRVIKNGVLVCFEGQKMTMAEAQRLGLVVPKKGAAKNPAPSKPAEKKANEGEAEQKTDNPEATEGEPE